MESGEVLLCKSICKYVQDKALPLVLHPVQPSHSISNFNSDPFRSLSKQVLAKLEKEELYVQHVLRIPWRSCLLTQFLLFSKSILQPTQILPFHLLSPKIRLLLDEEVARAVQSFPNGSAGGPDGLHPELLKDLTGALAMDGGKELLQALTVIVNAPLSILSGATLISPQRKRGVYGLSQLPPTSSSQVCQLLCPPVYAMHAPLLQTIFLLKLYFCNIFNCLMWDRMLMVVKDSIPAVSSFLHKVIQFCGEHLPHSAEGVQQGDPLGPLLLCLTIHPLLSQLCSKFRMFYLDDGTLSGSVEDVLSHFRLIEEVAVELGLSLNQSKTELICNDLASREAFFSESQVCK